VDLRDGGTGTGQTTSHVYSAAGSKTATCTVTDSMSTTASGATVVTISPAPSVTATVNHANAKSGDAADLHRFTLGGTGDVHRIRVGVWGRIYRFGSHLDTRVLGDGTFHASVVVTDANGGTASGTVTITISDLTVTASVSATAGLTGDSFSFTASGTGGGGANLHLCLELRGWLDRNRKPRLSHAYSAAGTFTPKVTVTDSLGRDQHDHARDNHDPNAPALQVAFWSASAWSVVAAVVAVVALLLRRRSRRAQPTGAGASDGRLARPGGFVVLGPTMGQE